MSTGTQIITRAYRMIGVKSASTPLSATEIADGLEALNAMLVRWEADGLAMGFSSLSSAGSTIGIPAEAEEGVCANLAVTLAPEFGVTPAPKIVEMADSGLRALQRDVLKPEPVCLDVPNDSARSYNIQTD